MKIMKISLLVLIIVSAKCFAQCNVPSLIPDRLGWSSTQLLHNPTEKKPSTVYIEDRGEAALALIAKLLTNYHRAAIVEKPLVVHINLLLIKVKATIEKQGIFESVTALFIEWYDRRLKWTPKEFANITELSMDPEKVGIPDIVMTNSADHLYAITRDYRFDVRVSYNGNMRYVPTGTARTWCDLKLTNFPFDFQKCSIEFESWSLDSQAMTFDGKSKLLLDKSFTSELWLVCYVGATTYNFTYFTGETFTRLRFDINVERKSTFYVINIIFPCATLSMIQLCVFIISSQDTTADRIGFGTTNLLTLVVFQTIVTEEMPKTSDAVTALSKYIISLIVLSAVTIFESVFVEHILSSHHRPPPKRIQRLFSVMPWLLQEEPMRSKQESYFNKKEPVFPAVHELVHLVDASKLPPACNWNAALTNEGSESDEIFGDASSAVNGNQRTATVVSVEEGGTRLLQIPRATTSANLHDNENGPGDGKLCRRGTRGRLRQSKRGVIGYNARNARLWKEIAFKIDMVAFLTCAILAIIIPIVLFVPIALVDNRCRET